MKHFLITILIFLFSLPVLAKNTLLIVGDSISAGYGIDPKQGWVALLEERLKHNNFNYQIVNASISGDTTSNGLSRLPAALNQYHPYLTIIELGANDGLRGLQVAIIKKNLDEMIRLTKASGSQVIVLGLRLPPNYGVTYTDAFQQIYLDLAKRNDITVIPLFLKNVDERADLKQNDGIHPNVKAQTLILDNVWAELIKKL